MKIENFTEVPEDLAAIEHEVIFGSYGGFKIENGKLFWFNGWVGGCSR